MLACASAISQNKDNPVVNLIAPFKTENAVQSSRQFIIGNTCKSCSIAINDKPAKVYSTGAFALEINLKPGDTSFIIKSENNGKSATKKINYSYVLPKPAEPVKTLSVESIQIYPEGDLVLRPGDRIKFKVKALRNCVVITIGGSALN